jgi:DNA-binding protein H-NS
MILEKMPTGKLESLRAEVEALIASKIAERREELQRQLSKLLEVSGSGYGSRTARGKTRSVPVKYRNPDDASQGWSGRGRMPLWLGAQINAGRDREEFLVG